MTLQHVPAEVVQQRRARIRQYSTLMDSQFKIPGTNQTFGIDPIIGLIPGAGGIIGLLMSAGIVVQAARYGARGWTLSMMLTNLALDATIGTIPFVGTVFDVVYKANVRNVALLDSHVVDPYQTTSKVRRGVFWSLFAIAVVTIILLGVVIGGAIWLITWIW